MVTRNTVFILLIILSVHVQCRADASEHELKAVSAGNLVVDASDFVIGDTLQQSQQLESVFASQNNLQNDIHVATISEDIVDNEFQSNADKKFVGKYSEINHSEEALGPLRIRSLSPANSLRLSSIPRSPYGVPEGQTEVQFNVAIANIGILKTEYTLDFEFSDTRLAILHGFVENWSAEVSFNERRIISAHLDRLRHNVHDLFGLDESDLPFNDTRISIPSLGVDLGREIRGIYSQTIGISVQKVLNGEDDIWPAFAVNLNLSYETHGSDLVDVHTLDYGIQFSVAKKQSNGYAYGNLGFTYFGSDESLDIQLKQRQLTGMLSYEFTLENDQALLFQYLLNEGVVENVNVLDEYTHEIHIGYKRRTGAILWELGLVENIINPDNTPDFAFTFGLSYRF